jgi:peptidyl-prolyl cis-trans isomerase D
VRSANNINFNSIQVPGAGMEPAVIGTAWTLEPNRISQPVAGVNGVYILKVTSVNQGTDQNVESEQMRMAQNLTFRATSQAFNAHREVTEIEDKRSKFY